MPVHSDEFAGKAAWVAPFHATLLPRDWQDPLPNVPQWTQALELHRSGRISDAELVAVYLLRLGLLESGKRFRQGQYPVALGCTFHLPSSPIMELLRTNRFRQLSTSAVNALLAWHAGLRCVALVWHVPSSLELLALQAIGVRHVSLLPEWAYTGHHPSRLAFATHDLCHLEKFNDPELYVEQVGFFSAANEAVNRPEWSALDAALDALWPAERDYVLADMNGSAFFLLLALKSRIRAAMRRRYGIDSSDTVCTERRQQADVEVAEWHECLFDWFGLTGDALLAARQLSARGTAVEHADALRAWFRARGAATLAQRIVDGTSLSIA